MIREVVVLLWSGLQTVQRLDYTAADVDLMSDALVAKHLSKLGMTIPEDVAEQRLRLQGWPTVADLDAIATAFTAANDGVRPIVRVLDASTLPARSLGPAGTVPR